MLESIEGFGGAVGQLRSHCVKGLQDDHHLVIAARVSCGDCERASKLLSYSRSQTQRRWNEVKDFILVPLGLSRHDDALAGIWLVLHSSCCASPSFWLLENDGRFASEVP